MPTSNVHRLARQGQGSCLSTHLCIWFMIIVLYVSTGRAQGNLHGLIPYIKELLLNMNVVV